MKHLLLTNDDGIFAPGLLLLLKAVKKHFRVTVVAPDEEKSACSLSITHKNPLQVKREELLEGVKSYSVNGTPADCVKLALSGGFVDKPDLIVSGINPGSNAGRNLHYSGTVSAVFEGALKGFPGVAFSMQWMTEPNFEGAVPIAEEIVCYLMGHPLPQETFLNVNFPSQTPYRGIKWTRQGLGVWRESPHTTCDLASGSAIYHLGMAHHLPEEEESDTHWLQQGFVTLVPLRISELTDHKILEERRELIFRLSKNWIAR